MFNVNYDSLLANNTPLELTQPKRIAWLKIVLFQVKLLYNTFVQYRSDSLYKLSFNGQIVYLKHVLNDIFDPNNRGVWIDNVADVNYFYLYNEIEIKPPFYAYNNYDNAATYAVGEFIAHQNKIWKCLTTNTGNAPIEGMYWTYQKDITYFKNLTEYASSYDFIVMIPVGVVFDIDKMRALINYYKAAGKRYTIQTY